MDLWSSKALSMALLGFVSLLCGVAPLCFRRWVASSRQGAMGGRRDVLISALSCFGGGIVLTTCLTHMLPEVNHMLRKNVQRGELPKTGMPLAEIFVLCGFFMIYLVEEVTHVVIRRCQPKQEHVNGHEHGCEDMLQHAVEHEHTFEATLRGFLVILSLSLHAVFEGIALGLTGSAESVWLIFVAIASHKYVISFCVGMQLVTSGVRPLVSALYVGVFSFISPLGAAIGLVMTATSASGAEMADMSPMQVEASLKSAAVTVLQGLATGTLLYVVFFEIIEKERSKGTNGMMQALFILLGFVCMLSLEYVARTHRPHHGPSSPPPANWTCSLERWESEWDPPPVNLTCVKGELTLTGRQ